MRKFTSLVLVVVTGFFGLASMHGNAVAQEPPDTAAAVIKDASGRVVGNALFTAVGGGSVRVQAWVDGLPAGEHGIHIHAVGACEPDFAAAGGHHNPTGNQHGIENPNGPHAGDLPELVIGQNGFGAFDTTNARIALTGSRSIFDTDGSAIVIHANPDDHVTDPTGNSGARIACGVIGAIPRPTGLIRASAEIRNMAGQLVGNALFTAVGGGSVRVQAWVDGLPAGEHGIHIHAVGACEPDFAAAGGHHNPTGNQHGIENPNGPHAGDLPELVIGQNGFGAFDTTNARIALTGSRSIFDADGSAIVIHANPDDHVTDPTGNSGARIACGVVRVLP